MIALKEEKLISRLAQYPCLPHPVNGNLRWNRKGYPFMTLPGKYEPPIPPVRRTPDSFGGAGQGRQRSVLTLRRQGRQELRNFEIRISNFEMMERHGG